MTVPILIVDDSYLMQQRLAALLGRVEGIRIVGTAGDFVAARSAIERLRPAIVTLDISMGERSGLDLIPWIRGLQPPVRVVVITNFPFPEFRLQARRLGVDAFVSKSASPLRITMVVQTLVAEIRASRTGAAS